MLKFALFFVFLVGISAQNALYEQDVIRELFNGRYDRRLRPTNGTAPVIVAVNMYVRSVVKIDDMNNEFEVQLTYRQKWRDDRLTYKAGSLDYVNLIDPSNLTWIPDTFFTNELEGRYHNLMVRNEFVRISPNGDILHSAKISLRLSCPMMFIDFPFDWQTCSIRLASYGYTTRDIKYVWEASDPIQVSSNLHLAKFNLQKTTTDTCDSKTNTGIYSCLRVDFLFQRNSTSYLLNIYIPSVMMVLIAISSLWISKQAVTARILLPALTLLTFASFTVEMNKTFPVTSDYTKAVDKWTGVCLTFVFATLLQFITVHYLSTRDNETKKVSCSDEENIGDEEPLKDLHPKSKSRLSVIQRFVGDNNSLPDKIDRASRVIFPTVFGLFVILYWFVYDLLAPIC